jgi:hypothetical protein
MREWFKWFWLMVRIEYHAMRCHPGLPGRNFDYHFDRALELIREGQKQEKVVRKKPKKIDLRLVAHYFLLEQKAKQLRCRCDE